ETTDQGATFTQLGTALDTRYLGYTIDLTATDPNRIYITAVKDPGPNSVGVLLTSKDHGKTWSEQVVPFIDTERALYIAAVDPRDADKVYIRLQNNPDKPGRLLVREANVDGGEAALRTIYTGKAP